MIYVIEALVDTGFLPDDRALVKIGTATDVEKRRQALQGPCPFELVLLIVGPGDPADEYRLHARYADQRWRGEWFALTDDELIDLIRTLRQQWTTAVDETQQIVREVFTAAAAELDQAQRLDNRA